MIVPFLPPHLLDHRRGPRVRPCALLLWVCHHHANGHGQAGDLPADSEAGKPRANEHRIVKGGGT